MRRVSPNPVICAFFCAIAAMGLSVCVQNPVDLKGFVEDDKVKEIAEQGQGKVILVQPDGNGDGGSEGIAGNGKITGLTKDKYYMIERWNEGTPPGQLPGADEIQFVSAAGACVGLEGIGRLNGTEIKTGLANNNIYRVTLAESLPKTNFNHTNEDPAKKYDGLITLKYTDAETSMTLTGLSGWYVIPSESPSSPISISGSIPQLKGAGTTTDYVFHTSFNAALDRDGFYELQVIIETDPSTTTNLTVTLTAYVNPADGTFTWGGDPSGNITWSENPNDQTVSVTVTGSTFDASPAPAWYYNGKSLGATLNNMAINTYNSTAGLTDEEKIDLTVADKWYEFMYVTGSGSTLRSATYTIKIGSK